MRKPFLMSKRERKIWGTLSRNEQRTWWKCSIYLNIGAILAIVSICWLGFFAPASETSIVALTCIISVGIIIMLDSMRRYANIFVNKLVS